MRCFIVFMTVFGLVYSLNAPVMAAQNDEDLRAMIETLEQEGDESGAKMQEIGTVKDNIDPTELAPKLDMPQPKPTAQSDEDVPSQNQTTVSDEEAKTEEDAVEEVVVFEVFSPDFMSSLRVCRKDTESKNGRTFEIKGMRNGKCHLTYGNYILDVPTTLLSSIHGFDDLHAFLKNKDMARYKYLPEYTYEGLIFALESCAHKEKFYGVEEEENRVDATIVRGLSSDYFDNHCEIYLQNELELESEIRDYSITCRLSQEAIDELEPYFSDITEKYGDLEPTQMHQQKEVRDADIALMYYLQQNNYCRKNNELQN